MEGVRARVRARVRDSRWSPPLVCATASNLSKQASDWNMARVPWLGLGLGSGVRARVRGEP